MTNEKTTRSTQDCPVVETSKEVSDAAKALAEAVSKEAGPGFCETALYWNFIHVIQSHGRVVRQ